MTRYEWADDGVAAGRGWTLVQDGGEVQLTIGDQCITTRDEAPQQLRVRRRWLVRWELEFTVNGQITRYRLVSRSQAHRLRGALQHASARIAAHTEIQQVLEWSQSVISCIEDGLRNGRWIPEELIHDAELRRPVVNPNGWVEGGAGGSPDEFLSQKEQAALNVFASDLRGWFSEINEQIVRQELVARRDFFERIESSPLTEEQARAVICFDNRVNVVAAAGSGKTSVMVARAAYAIYRGFIKPDRILLLAFNKAAAEELQERVAERLSALEIPHEGLKASTFHAFGLRVIGAATGEKPRAASWLDGGQDVGVIVRIVDQLRDESTSFRFKWDMFRLLYARVSSTPDADEFDAWDKSTRRTGFATCSGRVVRSEGERLIADWLFFNGVKFEYERPFSVPTATTEHSQYRPDFYYPEVDVWHEHWAIGYDGQPPEAFVGYAESMSWKRDLHRAHGTTLIETEWVKIVDESGFPALAKELQSAGLQLDWNPDRHVAGQKPMEHKELARLVRTFMAHVKSNSLTPQGMQARLADAPSHLNCYRTQLFVDLYWQIHKRWNERLADDQSVDFEDMLVDAAQHIETGAFEPQSDLVLVDEFQDASQARAGLVAALVQQPDRYLLAVGDDWQAINRFAGADISVMTDFTAWFGAGQVLSLQTTFRCTQEICDVSSAFVSKNPRQIGKKVNSVHGPGGRKVSLLFAESPQDVRGLIKEWLDDLADDVGAGTVQPTRGDVVTVDVLGRYRFDQDLVPQDWKARGVKVAFRTIHGAKGLEADYVIVPNLGRGKYGFPSQIADDPVLELAMSRAEDFPHSEERRLMYVALTRARRQAILIGVKGAESPFLTELMADGLVETGGRAAVGADSSAVVVCPTCKKGTLVIRKGPYGEFYGCTSFPRCRHTEQRLNT